MDTKMLLILIFCALMQFNNVNENLDVCIIFKVFIHGYNFGKYNNQYYSA